MGSGRHEQGIHSSHHGGVIIRLETSHQARTNIAFLFKPASIQLMIMSCFPVVSFEYWTYFGDVVVLWSSLWSSMGLRVYVCFLRRVFLVLGPTRVCHDTLEIYVYVHMCLYVRISMCSISVSICLYLYVRKSMCMCDPYVAICV